MTFQPHWIIPTSASLFGHVFENSRTGLARGLFWNLSIACQPIRHGTEDMHCEISCDWLTWPMRRWPSLDGQSLDTTNDNAKIEASVYLMDHFRLRVRSLLIHRIPATARFIVDIDGEFDLNGWGDLDGKNIAIGARCEAEFKGLVALGANFEPPITGAAALNLATAPFIDLADFHPVKSSGDQYRWEPIATAS
jgi:hypothetical protein